MNEIKIFENQEFGSVRTIEEDGKVLFCGNDIAKALGYVNPRKALIDHCRCVTKRDVPHPQSQDKTIEMSFVPEGDVYRLIAHSKLPSAEKFESWVFDEVLPTIRKHDAYMSPEVIEKTLTDPDFIIQLATQLKEEQIARKLAENKIVELAPKAEFHDAIATAENCVDFGHFAGVFQNNKNKKLGRNTIMKWCRSQNYLCSSNSLWNKPSQKMIENDYMEYRENVDERNGESYITYTPLLTGKGQIWLTKRLLEETL